MNILDKIKEIQKIRPKPGDTIIIKCNNINSKTTIEIKKFFEDKYGKEISILILPLDSEISLIDSKDIGDNNG